MEHKCCKTIHTYDILYDAMNVAIARSKSKEKTKKKLYKTINTNRALI